MNARAQGTLLAALVLGTALGSAQAQEHTALNTAVMACARAPASEACDTAMRTVTAQAAARLAPYDADASARCKRAAEEMISMEIAHTCHTAAVRAEHGAAPSAPARAALGAHEIRNECAALARSIAGGDADALTEQCVRNAEALLTQRAPQADLRPLFEAECKAIEEVTGRTMTISGLARCERGAARAWIEQSDPETVARWQARYRAFVCSHLIAMDREVGAVGTEHLEEIAQCMHVLELGR